MKTERQEEILEAFNRLGSQVEAARELGISRNRVYQIVRDRDKSPKFVPSYYQDTGCPDGRHKSCLNCLLEECRYDTGGRGKSRGND